MAEIIEYIDCSAGTSAVLFSNYPDCLNVIQLQQILCVGKNTAYKLLETGQIKHRRLGKKYLIPKVYVIEFLMKDV